jgi:hypothetical protein
VGRDPRAARCGRPETERRSCRPLRTVTSGPTCLTADAGYPPTTHPGQPPSQHGSGSGTSCGLRGCPDAPPLRSGLSSDPSGQPDGKERAKRRRGRRSRSPWPSQHAQSQSHRCPRGAAAKVSPDPAKDRQSRGVHTGIAMPDRLRRSADPSTVHGPPVRRVPGPI